MPHDGSLPSKSTKRLLDSASLLASDLRLERRSQGITLERLSALAGVAIANLHRLETDGQGRVATLRKVADALSVRIVGLPGRALANDLPGRFILARQKAGLTVAELAAKAGVSRDAIVRLEGGGGNLSTMYAALSALKKTVRLKNEMARVWAPSIGDRDARFTPSSVLDPLVDIFGPISLDPCWAPECLVEARQTFNKEQDGLFREWWGEFVWCNPPYSNSQAWVSKCRAEYESGRAKCVVALLKSTTYGQTFQTIALTADTIFLPKRVSFMGPSGRAIGDGAAPFGLIFYIWGASSEQVGSVLEAFGGRHLPPAISQTDALGLYNSTSPMLVQTGLKLVI